MFYPTGMLVNTVTKRFHPISFQTYPMPGSADAQMTAQRYKSLGHHTVGFDDEESAIAWIDEQVKAGKVIKVKQSWEWDGEGVPAMIAFFTREELFATQE